MTFHWTEMCLNRFQMIYPRLMTMLKEIRARDHTLKQQKGDDDKKVILVSHFC
jgi:uncharacterized protein with NAD-binding domain and iron-sulfur cluster